MSSPDSSYDVRVTNGRVPYSPCSVYSYTSTVGSSTPGRSRVSVAARSFAGIFSGCFAPPEIKNSIFSVADSEEFKAPSGKVEFLIIPICFLKKSIKLENSGSFGVEFSQSLMVRLGFEFLWSLRLQSRRFHLLTDSCFRLLKKKMKPKLLLVLSGVIYTLDNPLYYLLGKSMLPSRSRKRGRLLPFRLPLPSESLLLSFPPGY